MPAAQGDSRTSEKLKTGASERPRAPWGKIVLGLALLACALVLYLYASSNTPRVWRDSDNLDNINRATPATPTKTPEPKGDANKPR